jgi:hypothetical protein
MDAAFASSEVVFDRSEIDWADVIVFRRFYVTQWSCRECALVSPSQAELERHRDKVGHQISEPDRLIGGSNAVAGKFEIHEMSMDGGVMKMRAMTAIDVPAGGKLELKPGSYHVMLVDLAQPIKMGDKVPLKLTFRDAGSIDIVLHVQAMGAMTHGQ